MARMTLIALILACFTLGCSDVVSPPVVWVEGEAYVEGPKNETEGIGDKLPASGGKALYGAVLGNKDGYAKYRLTLAEDVPDARMLVRYSRYHWREMPPAEVSVTLTSGAQGVTRTVTMDNTGGWGSKKKADWRLASVSVGTLLAGDWTVQFSAMAEKEGDVNIDGFFLIPAGETIIAEELSAADRIDIDGFRYVGVAIPSAIIQQQTFETFDLPARGFEPIRLHVAVTLLDDAGIPVAELLGATAVIIDNDTRQILISGRPLRELPDGEYTIRVDWGAPPKMKLPDYLPGQMATGSEVRLAAIGVKGVWPDDPDAPTMELPVFLVGQLAADFDDRLGAISVTREWLAGSDKATHAAFVADYTHAIEFLTAAWRQVSDGSANKATLASVRRVLEQYETTTEMLKANQPPYARRTGDFRLAFVSAATGRLEEYRLFLPESYSPAGKTPLLMALNHNVNKYLDQADGTTRRIANQRDYAILAPGAVGTDQQTADYQGDGEKDMVQLLKRVLRDYPGLDRTRVYCTGTSRGGFGTYSLATAHPEFFAAIACSSGTGMWQRDDEGNRVLVEKFAPVPTLILHGEIDNLVSQDVAKQVAAKLAELEMPHELHIFPSYGHSYENYAEQYLTMSLDYFDRYSKPEAEQVDLTPPAPVPTAAPEPAPEAAPTEQPKDEPETETPATTTAPEVI